MPEKSLLEGLFDGSLHDHTSLTYFEEYTTLS